VIILCLTIINAFGYLRCQLRANKLAINLVSYGMIKNSLIILLLAGLLSCSQSAQKQATADTTEAGATDTMLTNQSIVDDSAADKLIASDTSTSSPVAADRLISPGKGIGHILIDQDLELALKQLGKPDSSDAAMGSSLMVWFAKHDTKGYRTSIFRIATWAAKMNLLVISKKYW
jgi:hypothetical protein